MISYMRNIVTVIEPEGPEDWFLPLTQIADVHFFYPKGPVKACDVSRIIDESDCVVITSATTISNEQLRATKRLRLIAKCGGAPSNIDVDFAAGCGIAVTCVPGANTSSIAEYTVMLIISMLRKYSSHIAAIRAGAWRDERLLGRDLGDSTVGVIGLGAIGGTVVRMLRAFNCRVLVYSTHACRDAYKGLCEFSNSLEEMLPQCDVVTLHSKVTKDNKNFFNARLFNLMKHEGIFINTARGALVDEAALASALSNSVIAAAAVDVFQTEPPLKENPLLKCPNAIITPHSSGWTVDALKRECQGAVASAIAFFNNQDVPGLINVNYLDNKRN